MNTLLDVEIAFTRLQPDNLLLLRSQQLVLRELTLIYTGVITLQGVESLADSLSSLVVLGSEGVGQLCEIEASVFGKLKHLRRLNLSENNITRVTNLEQCTNLKELCLCRNKIAEVDELPQSLRLVDFSSNALKGVPTLPSSLHQVYLSANRFANVEDLVNLQSLYDVRSISLDADEHGPCSPLFTSCEVKEALECVLTQGQLNHLVMVDGRKFHQNSNISIPITPSADK